MYDPDEIARAGAFVSIDGSGALRIERGYVRPEDEPPIPNPSRRLARRIRTLSVSTAGRRHRRRTVSGPADQEEAGRRRGREAHSRSAADRAHRISHARLCAMRSLKNPDVAFLAALHALCLKLFYRYTSDSCLEIEREERRVRQPGARSQRHRHREGRRRAASPLVRAAAAGAGRPLGRAARVRHRQPPRSVRALRRAQRSTPCTSPGIGVRRALAHADRLAEAIDLDIAAAGWSPTVDNYLGRVTKARILQAVREAKGEQAAQLIDHLKKGEMAEKAQDLLDRHGLAAGAAAHAWPGNHNSLVDARTPIGVTGPVRWRRIDGNRRRNGHGRFQRSRPRMRPPRQTRTQSRPSSTPELRVTQGPAGNGGPSSSRSALMSTQASDLARRLAEHAETVCRHYLSNGTACRPLLDRRRRSQHTRPIHVRPPERTGVRQRRRRQMDGRSDRRARRSARRHPQNAAASSTFTTSLTKPDAFSVCHGLIRRPVATLDNSRPRRPVHRNPPAVCSPCRSRLRAPSQKRILRKRGITAFHEMPRSALSSTLLLPARCRCTDRDLAGTDRRRHRPRRQHHRRASHLARSIGQRQGARRHAATCDGSSSRARRPVRYRD